MVRGEIPSPLDVATGCRFRTRCPLARDVCAEEAPPAVDLGDGRVSRCHFAHDVVAGAAAPARKQTGHVDAA